MKELQVNINDEEMQELMKVFKTNDEAESVKMAINEAIKKQAYSRILALKGNATWEGNLEEMRAQRI